VANQSDRFDRGNLSGIGLPPFEVCLPVSGIRYSFPIKPQCVGESPCGKAEIPSASTPALAIDREPVQVGGKVGSRFWAIGIEKFGYSALIL